MIEVPIVHTPAEVARFLRISDTTVLQLCRDRKLAHYKHAERVYRIPVSAVRDYVRRHRLTPDPSWGSQ